MKYTNELLGEYSKMATIFMLIAQGKQKPLQKEGIIYESAKNDALKNLPASVKLTSNPIKGLGE